MWVLCGDSEMAEGSMWEAFQHAGWEGLDNLTAIIDVNRLGQTRETMLGWDLDGYVRRIEAFGWKAIAIDGHDVEAIEAAYAEAEATTGQPTAIIAKTMKGRGVKAVEDQPGKHGKPLDDPEAAIAELGGERKLTVDVAKPEAGEPHVFETPGVALPSWELGEEVATRKAYGETLAALGSRRADVVALDGEVSNSTHSEDFREAHPDRYFEMFIAEQQLVAAAIGMQVRGWTPYVSTFSAFLSRAYDFVRMGAISRAKLVLSGSHAGVSIGEDGPSQMALEDIASIRAIHGSTVVHPSDANQTAKLVELLADRDGISFIRTLRAKTPVRTAPDEDVTIGGSRLAREGDDVAIIACGITRRRGGQGRRAARRRRRRTPACSTATRSSRSTPRPSAPRRATAARSSPSRTTPPRAASATRCSRRSPRATTAPTWSSSPCARSPAPARPRSCCTAR